LLRFLCLIDFLPKNHKESREFFVPRNKSPSPPFRDYVAIEKTGFLEKERGGRVGGLPGSGLSKDNETLPKDLER